jgi:Fatty acid hydroxylase superfamily
MGTERSWAATFARFQPGRIPILGPIAIWVADWSRPQRGEAPMFDTAWLERLSVAHPAVPFAVYAPAGVWFTWRSWTSGSGLALVAGGYVAGLFAWSLLEYVAHRASFHHAPTSRLQLAFGYLMHGVHHAYPDDSRRWVMPLSVTLPISIALYLVVGRLVPALFGGFLHGYLTYDLLHYFIHRGRMPTALGRFLRQYHMTHHYATPDRHFGVSSPLWDVVFRTR